MKLENFNPSEHKSFIDLTVESALDPMKQQLKISDSGIVNVNFISKISKEINFNYDYRNFNLIVSPNEEIEIDLKIDELLDWSKFENFKVGGLNSEINTLIISNTSYIDSLIQTATSAGARDGTCSDIEYKNLRLDEMNSHLKFFEGYISEAKIIDKTFIDWGKAQIKYSVGNDLSIYPFMGTYNQEIDDKSEYFDFVEKIGSKTSNELIYLSYLEYLNNLSSSLRIMSNISDTYSKDREQLKKDSTTNFPIAFDMIKRLPDNKEREYIMAYAFLGNKMVPESYRDSLKLYVNSNLIAIPEIEDENENLNIRYLIENYNISEKEKKELLDLYADTEGKVIFHDFWFATCAPCIKEFPHYKDLIASNDNDVVFIFYGTYMKEKEWKNTIEEFDLKGRHHLLSKDQLAFFQKYFGVQGFPHHQLINANGNIVKERIQRVYPSSFERINELITKHKFDSNKETDG